MLPLGETHIWAGDRGECLGNRLAIRLASDLVKATTEWLKDEIFKRHHDNALERLQITGK